MISAKVTLDKRRLQSVARRVGLDADDVVEALAREGERLVKQSFSESPRTGRRYKRGKRAVHIASSPGNAPRMDYGALTNSITIEKPRMMVRMITTGVDYAIYLEYGTAKMAARPFMRPMGDKLRGELTRFFRDFIKG